MHKNLAILLCALVALACLSGCGSTKEEQLTVTGGEIHTYQCEGGEQITVRYYALSDKSLQFVKVTLPDGQVQTLPNAMSGSGARYTDDRLWVWWNKGETGFVETRNDNGEWYTAYNNCLEVSK
jgi:membrane-bound inhibitor of C-type lysozyme